MLGLDTGKVDSHEYFFDDSGSGDDDILCDLLDLRSLERRWCFDGELGNETDEEYDSPPQLAYSIAIVQTIAKMRRTSTFVILLTA